MRAFTLIEMIVIMALLIAVAMISIPVASRFQADSQLSETANIMIQNIRLAAQDSLSGFQSAHHGLKFFPDYYVIFQGDNYASRQPDKDRVITWPSSLSLSWQSDLAGDELVFDNQGLAQTAIRLDLVTNEGRHKILDINQWGVIKQPL